MAKLKQSIKRSARNKNAKYSLTYKTVYKLCPIENSSSYKYIISQTKNLTYKGS